MNYFLTAIIIFVCSLTTFSFGQFGIVLNNDVYITIDANAQIVIENPLPSGITTLNSGGNIVSESETDLIKWNIGNSIGVYQIPFTTTPVVQGGNGVKIPFEINLVTPGSSSGHLSFSTYETISDFNLTYPSVVTSMNNPLGVDQSLSVVDRFWIIENSSYTIKPDVIMSFGYDDALNEIGGSNSIIESSLRAERWNTSNSSWESILFGSTDPSLNLTSNAVVSAADFFSTWTLIDEIIILPALFGEIYGEITDCLTKIHWETLSEHNCDHFSVFSSVDALIWEELGVVEATGESSTLIDYSFIDFTNYDAQTIYYKIVQVDLNGDSRSYPIIALMNDCSNGGFSVYPNPVGDICYVKNFAGFTQVEITDSRGSIVHSEELSSGVNELFIGDLSSGVYFLKASDAELKNNQTTKIFKL